MPWPYGSPAPRDTPAQLDRWVPPSARRLEHHAIDVGAEPAVALAAISGVQLRDVPIVGALFSLRGLPFQSETTLLQFFGTTPFLILEKERGRELVFGVVGPFWRWRGTSLPTALPRSAEEFRAAMDGGRMAAIGNFRVEPSTSGSRLWTETWVSAPGRVQSVFFTAYWLLVGPFSAWIRRILLRAARRRTLAQ
jgi:hypothetical protein